ncbi:MAG: hypothetical protein ACRBBP_04600 [Bdellovibrionales bacterium]
MTPSKGRFILFVYAVLFPVLLVVQSLLWKDHPWLWLLMGLGPGAHSLLQLGLIQHELGHRYYFKGAYLNRLAYTFLAFYLCSDPQFDRIVHPTHHKNLHTFEDLELWPRGKPSTKSAARQQLVLELMFGRAAWVFAALPAIRASKEYRWWKELGFLLSLLGFHLILARICVSLGGPWYAMFATIFFNLWVASVLSRYLQFIEHLGILAPELPLAERNLLCRNVGRDHWMDRVWHVMTSCDTENHQDHHTHPEAPVRVPFGGANNTVLPIVSICELPTIVRSYWDDPFRVTQ